MRRGQKPKKIAVLGLFGQQNIGNECTLAAFLASCRNYLGDAKIKCICTDPADTTTQHKVPAIALFPNKRQVWPQVKNPVLRWARKLFVYLPREMRHWLAAFRSLKDTEVLAIPGTGLLTDAYQNSFGTPYTVFKWSMVARLRGCKTLFVSVGAGPMDRPLTRWFIRTALSTATFRSYRDNSTKDCVLGIGLLAKDDPIYPDLVFNMPVPQMLYRGNSKGPRRRIAIGIMSYGGKPSADKHDFPLDVKYLEKVVTFLEWLIANEYDVRILFSDSRYDPPALDYMRTLLTARLSCEGRRRVIDQPVSSSQDLLSELAATDAVVATRFHNVLLALMLEKPVISISFHQKCSSLMSQMGLSKYCQEIQDLNVEKLILQFRDLENNSQALRDQIGQRTKEFRAALDEQDAAIFNTVVSN
jgi:polysaccharide pyruvyl transferase WcaK-like protein